MCRLFFYSVWAFTVTGLMAFLPLSSSFAQDIYEARVTINTVTKEAKPHIYGPLINGVRERIDILPDNVFAKIDMSVIIDQNASGYIKKMVDQGFTDEPSGCAPGQYGPLDMGEGLRYFLDVSDLNPRQFQFTFYPGEKSSNWANGAYCEYDAELGNEMAIVRFTGFYHVRHHQLEEGTDITFSAFPVSPEKVAEISALQ